MTFEPIGILAFAVGIASLFLSPTFIIYCFFMSTLLGAAAAFNLSGAGISIPPAHIIFVFLFIRLFFPREIQQNVLQSIGVGRPAFWLAITLATSLVTTYFMPRLFQGEIFVFPVRAQYAGLAPLEPATSNFTQSAYFIADATCFAILSGYAETRGGIKVLINAGLAAATLNIVFAGLDLFTYFTGTAELLSPIRNASYSMLVETDMGGFKRIVGSFTEASSFGGMTIGYFAFTSRLWLLGSYPRFSGILALLSLIAILFATSSTGYVGLAGYLAVTYVEIFLRVMSRPSTRQMQLFILIAPPLLLVVGLAIALSDSVSGSARELSDMFLFEKLSSSSGIERSTWNMAALQSFFDTYGLGVGNGSGRASSFAIAVLSNLGIFGLVPFTIFLLKILFGQSSQLQSPVEVDGRLAARSTCLSWIIAASVSSPLIDLGLQFYAFAAIASAGYAASGVRLYQNGKDPSWHPSAFARGLSRIAALRS
jgi:hypothetical protein